MDPQQTSTAIESALATLQPLRDLSRNWDVDIASWYVAMERFPGQVIFLNPY